MAYSADFIKLAQSVHLTTKNRYFDDISTTADGTTFMDQVADWANLWVSEMETMTDRAGNPVIWKFARNNAYDLGSVSEGDTSIEIDDDVDMLVATPPRYALLVGDSGIVSKWAVCDIDQLYNTGIPQEDRVAMVGEELFFSRAITEREDGASLEADVSLKLPLIDEPTNNFDLLTMVRPRQLLILGIAKNSTLPDLVRGGLSPSFLQRYQDLLNNAIQKNYYTSQPSIMGRDNLSYIGGVGF